MREQRLGMRDRQYRQGMMEETKSKWLWSVRREEQRQKWERRRKRKENFFKIFLIVLTQHNIYIYIYILAIFGCTL